jgi:hypothetical protein
MSGLATSTEKMYSTEKLLYGIIMHHEIDAFGSRVGMRCVSQTIGNVGF